MQQSFEQLQDCFRQIESGFDELPQAHSEILVLEASNRGIIADE